MPDALDTALAALDAAHDAIADGIAALADIGVGGSASSFWPEPATEVLAAFEAFRDAVLAASAGDGIYFLVVPGEGVSAVTTTASLIATSKAAVVVKNLTTGATGTAAAPLALVPGANLIHVADTTATLQIVPFDAPAAAPVSVRFLAIRGGAANLNFRPVPAAWGSVTAAMVITQAGYSNTLEGIYYEGPKTSLNYYFAGLRNLQCVELRLAGATTLNAFALGAPDLRHVAVRCSAAVSPSLANAFRHTRLATLHIGHTGTGKTYTGFASLLSHAVVGSLTLSATLAAAANTTAFAGLRLREFSLLGAALSVPGYTLTLALYSMPPSRALSFARALGALNAATTSVTLQLGLGIVSDAPTLAAALADGFTVTFP
jgi:hypothetical protein